MAPSSTLGFFWEHMYAQLFIKPPEPNYDFSDQTIIVTGSNGGIGLETARWFVRLGAAKVILAVRSIAKGEHAAEDIRASTKCEAAALEVWQLDLASSESVEDFAARARQLERLDVLVANAGVYLYDFEMADGNEMTITVNVINTFMLAFLLLPILRETSVRLGKEAVITFTGSFVLWLTKFPERKSEHIFQDLADEKTARMMDR
jgi:NAD(P)-dependent dehydrogenase (short-subunit alcohol dehydrogenase family)